MKQKLEILLIYATGLFQGLVLVTVPAASSVFTDPNTFGFSDSQYGALFIPQIIAAILGALLGPKVSKTWGLKKVYQAGLLFNILAMGIICTSEWFKGQPGVHVYLMLGTTFVGAGFGITLPMINVFAERLFPKNSASALTGLHTLLGTGTALAPLLVAVFVTQIGWWLLPAIALVALIIIFGGSFMLPLKGEKQIEEIPKDISPATSRLPSGVWLFLIIVFLYGYCETIFANWAIIFLNKEKFLSTSQASYALAAFWAMVTVGRLLVSFLSLWISPRLIYRVLPFMIAVGLFAVTTASSAISGIILFGFAGLACSAFFPLSFSFVQTQFASIAETVSGKLMASYMLGYGFAAYGIGKVVEISSFSLGSLYQSSTVVALGIIILGIVITRPIKVLALKA